MKLKAINNLIGILTGTMVSLGAISQAYAFSKNGEQRFVSQAKALKEAQEIGLGISNREKIVKDQIEKSAKKNPEWLSDRISDSLGDPTYYRSYLLEVRDGRDKVEKAKTLARLALYKAMKENWEYVKTSILNRNAVDSFDQFSHGLKRDLEKIEYIATRKPTNGYAFETVEWGRVLIAKNDETAPLKAKWSMDISSYLDSNELEPGAEKLEIDKESGPSFDPELDEEPVAAPVLAKPDRKQIIPQIRKSLQKPATGGSGL